MSISASASPPALAPCRQVEDPVITARALTKVYGRGAGAVTALDAVDVDIARGRFTAVMGPSGSGKGDADELDDWLAVGFKGSPANF